MTTVDGNAGSSTISRFSLTVPQNLVLFTFINGAASAGFLVRTRREGVMTRAMSSPASTGTLLAGLGIGWFAVALFQSLLIVVIGAVVFGMDWGNPLAAGILVVLWALVGAGAGLLVGAIADDPDRVSAISPPVGIVLGALGGCMIPFEVFSPTMQSIAKAVPHTWALNGWRTLVFDGGGVADIRGSIAVLSVWVVALLSVASVLLRRRLTSGS
ncbi:MAG: ABC transporter permease [Ilumatobacteraceae bacterium]